MGTAQGEADDKYEDRKRRAIATLSTFSSCAVYTDYAASRQRSALKVDDINYKTNKEYL
jgi:hypothetical protein